MYKKNISCDFSLQFVIAWLKQLSLFTFLARLINGNVFQKIDKHSA